MSGKSHHFICGLPRSGATLLANILAQNPRFHTTSPCGLLDLLFILRNQWNQIVEFKASPNEPGKMRVLRAVFQSFYKADRVKQPVVFDKCRAWLGMIEMAEAILERSVKVLVPVRDLRGVLSSFEKLWRTNPQMQEFTAQGGILADTVEGRCAFWLRSEQPLGMAMNRVQDAIFRGFQDRLHFVEFYRLTHNPKATLAAIHEFLEEAPFAYDFSQIRQVTVDIDEFYPLRRIPAVRPQMEPSRADWDVVLTPSVAARYEGMPLGFKTL